MFNKPCILFRSTKSQFSSTKAEKQKSYNGLQKRNAKMKHGTVLYM